MACWKETCHGFTDYFGDSGIPGTFAGYFGNFPMPAFIGMWMILVMVAGAMSSGDGCVLAMAVMFGHNVLEKWNVSRAELLKATR